MKKADEAKTAVLAFITYDFNTVNTVVNVAEELNIPVIVMFHPAYESEYRASTVEAFSGLAISEAERVKTPVALHLDHCSDFSYIKRAINVGFTSVMYDGSMYDFERNLRETKEVVDYAHARNVDVEAELGPIFEGADTEAIDNIEEYTQPEAAGLFCRETGCDSLAIAIGNAHGYYRKSPNLHFDVLERINDATDAFLVLHGGSGISNESLRRAFSKGINKLNIGIEFLNTYFKETVNYSNRFSDDHNHIISDHSSYVQKALTDYLRVKMRLSEF